MKLPVFFIAWLLVFLKFFSESFLDADFIYHLLLKVRATEVALFGRSELPRCTSCYHVVVYTLPDALSFSDDKVYSANIMERSESPVLLSDSVWIGRRELTSQYSISSA